MDHHSHSLGVPEDEDVAEVRYFQRTVASFDAYMRYHLQANHRRRMSFLTLPANQRTLLRELGYSEKIDAVDEAIRQNGEFLDLIIANGANPFLPPSAMDGDVDMAPQQAVISSPASSTELNLPAPSHDHAAHGHLHAHDHNDDLSMHFHSHSHEPPEPPTSASTATSRNTHSSQSKGKAKGKGGEDRTEHDHQQDKVRSTLRMFVRDWSAEGEPERTNCYKPCLDALERHFAHVPREARAQLKVLNPGAGLARMACEIAGKGFAAQGNELSAHMLIASNWVLNENDGALAHKIYPNCHSYSNQITTANHLLRSVLVPDVTPRDILQGNMDFSFVAGDFLEVYGGYKGDGSRVDVSDQEGTWAGVVTVFFIDVCRNVIKVLDTIYRLLDDNGVWINIGPLQWHLESSVDKQTGEGSIDLSLDEVKELARKMGFELREETMGRTTYSGALESMSIHEYQTAFWVATKI